MSPRPDGRSLRFEIAGFACSLHPACDLIGQGLEALYGRSHPPDAPPEPSFIRVRAARQAGADVLRYESCLRDQRRRSAYRQPRGALARAELEVSSALLAGLGDRLALHGATLQIGPRTVFLVGASGAGKSTTAAALAARGARLFADDFALLERDGLALTPVPRYLKLDADSRRLLRRAGLFPSSWTAALTPRDLGGGFPVSLRPDAFFLLQPPDDAPAALQQLSQSQMLIALLRHTCSNDRRIAARVRRLRPLVAHARCFSLPRGDLNAMAAAIESAVS